MCSGKNNPRAAGRGTATWADATRDKMQGTGDYTQQVTTAYSRMILPVENIKNCIYRASVVRSWLIHPTVLDFDRHVQKKGKENSGAETVTRTASVCTNNL